MKSFFFSEKDEGLILKKEVCLCVLKKIIVQNTSF